MCFNVDGKLAADLIIGAVGQENWEVEIKGKASHAGVAPGEGHLGDAGRRPSALAEAQRDGWFGKVVKPDGNGTSNVGIFGGKDGKAAGDATNVVTDYVHIKGEARSPDAAFAAAIAAAIGTPSRRRRREVKDAERRHRGGEVQHAAVLSAVQPGGRLRRSSKHAKRAAESLGLKPTTVFSNGGLDANWLDKHGVPTVTIGTGQYEIHTVKEYVDLPEFADGCRLAVALATLEG